MSHYARIKILDKDKYPSLFGPFISNEENAGLWLQILSQGAYAL
jgi:hypothetical protein